MPTWDYYRRPADLRHELGRLRLSDTSTEVVLAHGGRSEEIQAITKGLEIVKQLQASSSELEMIALTVETYPKLRIMGCTDERDREERRTLLAEILDIIRV